MAARGSPTEAIRAELHELFASDGELLSVLEQVARLSVRLSFQSVVEELVCQELGRERDQRRPAQARRSIATAGSSPGTLKPSLGPVQLPRFRPKERHLIAAQTR